VELGEVGGGVVSEELWRTAGQAYYKQWTWLGSEMLSKQFHWLQDQQRQISC